MVNSTTDPDLKLQQEAVRRISQAYSVKNVVESHLVKPEMLCGLCQAVLVSPLQCESCKQRFHSVCIAKFLQQAGHCPSMCPNETSFKPLADDKRLF